MELDTLLKKQLLAPLSGLFSAFGKFSIEVQKFEGFQAL